MKTIEIQGSKRVKVGKTAVKKVRYEDQVPAIVYGLGEPAPVKVDYVEFEKSLSTPDSFIYNIDIDGEVTSAVVREVQFHPVTDRVLHIDFMRVDDEHEIEVELPVELHGTPKGVLNGGRLVTLMRRIKVRGVPSKLPERVEVNVANLELGRTIAVRDLDFEGLAITSPSNSGVAMVDIPRAARQAAAAGEDGEEEEGEDSEEAGSEE